MLQEKGNSNKFFERKTFFKFSKKELKILYLNQAIKWRKLKKKTLKHIFSGDHAKIILNVVF